MNAAHAIIEKHAETQRPVDISPGTHMNVETKTDAGGQANSDSVSMLTWHLSMTYVLHTGNRVDLL